MNARIAVASLGFVLSAYAPLALVLAAVAFSESVILATCWFAVSIALGASVGGLLSRRATRTGARDVTFSDGEDQGGAVAGYLASYLLPFLAVPTENVGIAAGYSVFFLLVFFLHFRSNLGLINPTLYALGWRVSRVTVQNRRVFLIHRGDILLSGTMRVVEFNRIYIEKRTS